MIVAVTSGVVVQCQGCLWLMDVSGGAAIKAEALIRGAHHTFCPACTTNMLTERQDGVV